MSYQMAWSRNSKRTTINIDIQSQTRDVMPTVVAVVAPRLIATTAIDQ